MKTNFKGWLKAAGIRALKTLAQTAVATIGTCAVLSEVDWVMVASASALAAVLSLLTSVAGLPKSRKNKHGAYAPAAISRGEFFVLENGDMNTFDR